MSFKRKRSSPDGALTGPDCSSEGETWGCTLCTLQNPLRRRRCEACGAHRPVEAPETNNCTAGSRKRTRNQSNHPGNDHSDSSSLLLVRVTWTDDNSRRIRRPNPPLRAVLPKYSVPSCPTSRLSPQAEKVWRSPDRSEYGMRHEACSSNPGTGICGRTLDSNNSTRAQDAHEGASRSLVVVAGPLGEPGSGETTAGRGGSPSPGLRAMPTNHVDRDQENDQATTAREDKSYWETHSSTETSQLDPQPAVRSEGDGAQDAGAALEVSHTKVVTESELSAAHGPVLEDSVPSNGDIENKTENPPWSPARSGRAVTGDREAQERTRSLLGYADSGTAKESMGSLIIHSFVCSGSGKCSDAKQIRQNMNYRSDEPVVCSDPAISDEPRLPSFAYTPLTQSQAPSSQEITEQGIHRLMDNQLPIQPYDSPYRKKQDSTTTPGPNKQQTCDVVNETRETQETGQRDLVRAAFWSEQTSNERLEPQVTSPVDTSTAPVEVPLDTEAPSPGQRHQATPFIKPQSGYEASRAVAKGAVAFATAGQGQKIHVTAESLRRVSSLLSGHDKPISPTVFQTKGVDRAKTLAAGMPAKLSKHETVFIKHQEVDTSGATGTGAEETWSMTTEPVVFATAGRGRRIHVTAESLSLASSLLTGHPDPKSQRQTKVSEDVKRNHTLDPFRQPQEEELLGGTAAGAESSSVTLGPVSVPTRDGRTVSCIRRQDEALFSGSAIRAGDIPTKSLEPVLVDTAGRGRNTKRNSENPTMASSLQNGHVNAVLEARNSQLGVAKTNSEQATEQERISHENDAQGNMPVVPMDIASGTLCGPNSDHLVPCEQRHTRLFDESTVAGVNDPSTHTGHTMFSTAGSGRRIDASAESLFHASFVLSGRPRPIRPDRIEVVSNSEPKSATVADGIWRDPRIATVLCNDSNKLVQGKNSLSVGSVERSPITPGDAVCLGGASSLPRDSWLLSSNGIQTLGRKVAKRGLSTSSVSARTGDHMDRVSSSVSNDHETPLIPRQTRVSFETSAIESRDSSSSTPRPVAFATAGFGRKIDVSAESLSHAASLFNNQSTDTSSITPRPAAFATAGYGRRINVSAESMHRASSILSTHYDLSETMSQAFFKIDTMVAVSSGRSRAAEREPDCALVASSGLTGREAPFAIHRQTRGSFESDVIEVDRTGSVSSGHTAYGTVEASSEDLPRSSLLRTGHELQPRVETFTNVGTSAITPLPANYVYSAPDESSMQECLETPFTREQTKIVAESTGIVRGRQKLFESPVAPETAGPQHMRNRISLGLKDHRTQIGVPSPLTGSGTAVTPHDATEAKDKNNQNGSTLANNEKDFHQVPDVQIPPRRCATCTSGNQARSGYTVGLRVRTTKVPTTLAKKVAPRHETPVCSDSQRRLGVSDASKDEVEDTNDLDSKKSPADTVSHIGEASFHYFCPSFGDAYRRGTFINDPCECIRFGVRAVTLELNSETATALNFERHSGLPSPAVSDSLLMASASDCREILSERGCDTSVVTEKWIVNHYRWIVWKLASLERRFAPYLAGRCLTFETVIAQMIHRYNREMQEGARSPVRKLVNRDVSSGCMIILAVATIRSDCPTPKGCQGERNSDFVELTDGWYSVRASLDSRMWSFVSRGLIRVGSKLLISNAPLEGFVDGTDPLDADYHVYSQEKSPVLRLEANSCRLARWNAKLGFVSPRRTEAVEGKLLVRRIKDIYHNGGRVPLMDLRILRIYPILFLHQPNPQAPARVLTAKEESERLALVEKQKESVLDSITEDLRCEYLKVGNSEKLNGLKLRFLNVTSPISSKKEIDEDAPSVWHQMINDSIPSGFYKELGQDNKILIDRWRDRRSALLGQRIESETKTRFNLLGCNFGPCRPFLKALVDSVHDQSGLSEGAILTLWEPSTEHLDSMTEGSVFRFANLHVSAKRFDGRLQLSVKRHSPVLTIAKGQRIVSGILGKEPMSLYRLHLLSRAQRGDLVPPLQVDVVGIIVKVARSSNGLGWSILVTDQSGLCLHVKSEYDCSVISALLGSASVVRPTDSEESPTIFEFRYLQLSSYDTSNACAVAHFGHQSALYHASGTPRTFRLGTWQASERGRNRLVRLASQLNAGLLPTPTPACSCGSSIDAVGYIIGLHVLSSGQLMVQVDCGDECIQNWMLPLSLVEELTNNCYHADGSVSLNIEEEARIAKLSRLGHILRARQRLHLFRLTSTRKSSFDLEIQHTVTKVTIADYKAMSLLHVSAPENDLIHARQKER